MVYIYVLCAIAIVVAALLFIGMGMALANKYNQIAWEKYYEGMNQKAAKPIGVSIQPASGARKPR